MRCNSCGEPCKPNEVFCHRCGAPVSVVPDFNLLEQELANNIGEVMDSDGSEKEVNESVIKDETIDVFGETKTDLDIKNHDGSEYDKDFEDEYDDEYEDEYEEDSEEISDEDINYLKKLREKKKLEDEQKKKKIIIISICAAAAALVIILVLVFGVFGGNGEFKEHYDQAVTYIDEKNYEEAEKELNEAVKAAKTTEEKIKANEALFNLYTTMGNVENDKIVKVLNELVKLDSKNEKYKEWLLKYSTDIPKADIASGEYENSITVTLTSSVSTMYYTLDGSKPTQNSTKYTEPIEIKEEGKTTLKAVSYKDGKASEISEYTYTIKYTKLNEPKVTPAAGTYTENKQITVEVPDKCKAYYTYDGSTPNESSSEYTGPIDMIRGNNVFSVILINDKGVKSSVVSNVYNLDIAAAYSYNDAENLLVKQLIKQGALADASGKTPSGGKILFTYVKTENIQNKEYYVISAAGYDAAGNPTNTNYYGVGTADGSVVTLTKSASGNFSIR